jgi:murein DD-endopeptidase MepM/ murein hydrolase activator NlpD
MRIKSSPKFGTSVVKFAVAALLASAATGCSSDASRFSGLFSKTDDMTTASIPQRQANGAYGQAPTPRGDLGSAQALPPVSQGDYNSRSSAVNQPYPGNSGYSSPVRAAVAPVSVQRSELSSPTASTAPVAASRSMPAVDNEPMSRKQAMAQPFPGRSPASQTLTVPSVQPKGDSVVTGTVKPMSGWSMVNAPKVTIRPGETAATLSKRYGVPEKEILKANGGNLSPGQSVTIPTFGPARNSAKTAASDIDLQNNAPAPARESEQKIAVLPTANRDKALGEPAKLTPPGGNPLGGSYVVKPGDSLAKIAKATGTPIDQLKAANGLTSEGVRVGQTLKVVSGAAADPVKTASIPEKPAAAPKPVAAAAPVATSAPASAAPVAASAPASAKPVAETASLTEVEKKSDVSAAAPQSTGIGKYRWPVSGAVIAGYGANVDGNRNDGIDISVPEGTPIKSAENGVVIYAGNGLKQLGNTVLVRHDDGKVTVYGHAGNISVARGQKVTRGQTLASSGMSGDAKRPQVHFEVRKDATPVNPITFLE